MIYGGCPLTTRISELRWLFLPWPLTKPLTATHFFPGPGTPKSCCIDVLLSSPLQHPFTLRQPNQRTQETNKTKTQEKQQNTPQNKHDITNNLVSPGVATAPVLA